MEEIARAVVLLHGSTVERISRIELKDITIRVYVKDHSGQEVLLTPPGLSSERLSALLGAHGAALMEEVAERLFRHAGFEMDRFSDPESNSTTWLRKTHQLGPGGPKQGNEW